MNEKEPEVVIIVVVRLVRKEPSKKKASKEKASKKDKDKLA
jgi:hypothetical protein